MKNDFEKLIEQAAQSSFKSHCSIGDWCFEANDSGTFTVSHNGEVVVACENHQIVDVKWGSRIEEMKMQDILTSLMEHFPEIHLNALAVRTEDGLAVLGYKGSSQRMMDILGLDDFDYDRAWIAKKPNRNDYDKNDYVIYWDQGNSWCEVLGVFEGVTHEEFLVEARKKYREWIREDAELTSPVPAQVKQKTSLDRIIQSASVRTAEHQPVSDTKVKESKSEHSF